MLDVEQMSPSISELSNEDKNIALEAMECSHAYLAPRYTPDGHAALRAVLTRAFDWWKSFEDWERNHPLFLKLPRSMGKTIEMVDIDVAEVEAFIAWCASGNRPLVEAAFYMFLYCYPSLRGTPI
jgi:hypothetical protein